MFFGLNLQLLAFFLLLWEQMPCTVDMSRICMYIYIYTHKSVGYVYIYTTADVLQPRENIWKNFRLSYSWRVYIAVSTLQSEQWRKGLRLFRVYRRWNSYPVSYIWGLIINNKPRNKDPIINQSIFHGNFGPVFFVAHTIFISQHRDIQPALGPPQSSGFWRALRIRYSSTAPGRWGWF